LFILSALTTLSLTTVLVPPPPPLAARPRDSECSVPRVLTESRGAACDAVQSSSDCRRPSINSLRGSNILIFLHFSTLKMEAADSLWSESTAGPTGARGGGPASVRQAIQPPPSSLCLQATLAARANKSHCYWLCNPCPAHQSSPICPLGEGAEHVHFDTHRRVGCYHTVQSRSWHDVATYQIARRHPVGTSALWTRGVRPNVSADENIDDCPTAL
jgi:hypothetical protein